MLPAKSRAVIVLAWTRLLLGGMVNPSSSSLPLIAFLIAKSNTITKRKGASVSPCSTPIAISNKSVSPSGDKTFALVSVYRAMIVLSRFGGTPYALRILNIFSLFILSNAFVKSMKVITAGRFFAFIPSISRRSASICPVVVRPVLNPFWFGLSLGSISGRILFSIMRFMIFVIIALSEMPR